MKLFKRSCSALLISMASTLAFAETAVIVSISNPNSAMDQTTVSKIFLGKAKSFPDGSQALPVDQDEGSAVRESFNSIVLGKSDSQLKSYWSRLIFTGKGTPPKQSGNDASVKQLVANSPNIIGYIDSSAVDATVKVVHKF
ncbi:MAG: ABC-type phosphate transport system substrate-binding protein [Oleispira sp.]|jgi:ABC-type phosphate transport system substrate-binding protein